MRKKSMAVFTSTMLLSCLLSSWSAAEDSGPYRSFNGNSLVKSDGTFWVWGARQSVPTQLHGISDVDAAYQGNMIVKQDGTIWYWEKQWDSSEVTFQQATGLVHPVDIKLFFRWILALDSAGNMYYLPRVDHKPYLAKETDFILVDRIDNVALMSHFNEYSKYKYGGVAVNFVNLFLKRDGTVWRDEGHLEFERVGELEQVIDLNNGFALKDDGTVWLIHGLSASQVKGLSDIQKIRTGGSNLAIDDQSRLWYWRMVYTDKLTTSQVYVNSNPILLKGVNKVKDAYVVGGFIVVLTEDGYLYKAANEEGNMRSDAPFERMATNVTEMKNGGGYIIVQKTDGSLWGFGYNQEGQLGVADYEYMHDTLVPGGKPIPLIFNGESVPLFNGVIVRNDTSFVPIRAIFERMGAKVHWDAQSNIVTINRSEQGKAPVNIRIDYNSGEVFRNGEPVKLQQTPFILSYTSYVPLRFISESLGAKVDWSQTDGVGVISIEYNE